MPSKPPRPCSHADCPALVTDGARCPSHQKAEWRREAKAAVERRPEDKKFYDSALWQKTRSFILRTEPWCRECVAIGKATPATMVDHKVRLRDGGLRLDPSNLQPLCEVCHNRKRWAESQLRRAG